tara:strand:- start:875 stop:1285 length:411 start_codon:yes stop_codon:yes gene_type:complete
MRFFIFAAILFSGYANALHSDGCDPNNGLCMSHLTQDISDSNDQATLLMVGVVGGTVYYFMNRRIADLEDKEKDDFLQEINSTGRLPILRKNNFEIAMPIVRKQNDIFENSLNFGSYHQLNKFNSKANIIELRLSF